MTDGNFNWTLPNVSEDTSCGLKVHIRHLRRKKAAMCKLLKSDPHTRKKIVSEDKETGKLKDGVLKNMEGDYESKIENYFGRRKAMIYGGFFGASLIFL